MAPSLDKLFDTPELHFVAFDKDDALFIQMDRASYHRSIFLDHRAFSPNAELIRTPVAPLIAAARDRPILRTGWIFHFAHCGSTLLSRLIDSPESALVLREPRPLRQLGVLAARSNQSEDWAGRLKLALALVSRRFEPSQPTVVKANVPVNFIMPEIIQLDAHAPVVLLYLRFEPYLLAILREQRRREWVNRVTRLLEPTLATRVGLKSDSNTAERAAALWLAQMLMFNAVVRSNARVRIMDAEALFASPVETAEAAAKHFGLCLTDETGSLNEVASVHSKDPSRSFNDAVRQERELRDKVVLRDDLELARRWMEQAPAAADLPDGAGQRVRTSSPPQA